MTGDNIDKNDNSGDDDKSTGGIYNEDSEIAGSSGATLAVVKPISETGARQLMELMISRRYFHQSSPFHNCEHNQDNGNAFDDIDGEDGDDDSFESFQRYKNNKKNKSKSKNDIKSKQQALSCTIISSLCGDIYYTKHGLLKRIETLLLEENNFNGRISLLRQSNELEQALKVSCDTIIECIKSINENIPISFELVGMELISYSYWKQIKIAIQNQIQQAPASLSIVDLANQYQLPIHVFSSRVIHGLPQHNAQDNKQQQQQQQQLQQQQQQNSKNYNHDWTCICNGERLVSTQYLHQIKQNVLQYIQESVTKPTTVASICQNHVDWDPPLVVSWITEFIQTEQIQGKLQHDSNNSTAAAVITKTTSSKPSVATTTISTSSSCSANFIPLSYSNWQTKSVQDFFSSNGYITSEIAQGNYNVLPSQVINMITAGTTNRNRKETTTDDDDINNNDINNDSIVIVNQEHGSIIAEYLVQTIQEAIQETTDTILDLQSFLPIELLSQSECIDILMKNNNYNDHKNDPTKMEDKGIALVIDNVALYIGRQLINQIYDSVMPKLIQEYAVKRAQEVADSQQKQQQQQQLQEEQQQALLLSSTSLVPNSEEDSEIASNKKGSKKRRNNNNNSRRNHHHHHDSMGPSNKQYYGIVPLSMVIQEILNQYPDLILTEGITTLPKELDLLSWDEYENDDNIALSNNNDSFISCNVLVEFCKQAFSVFKIQESCHNAIHQEIKKLQKQRTRIVTDNPNVLGIANASTATAPSTATMTLQSLEESFEHIFHELCLVIQLSKRFIDLVAKKQSDDNNALLLTMLQEEFLTGWCAEFTSRLTQYCLYQNNDNNEQDATTASIFSYTKDDSNNDNASIIQDDHNLPPFCKHIDSIKFTSKTAPAYLSTRNQSRSPLTILRESLASHGDILAKLWMCCGGTCYQGGSTNDNHDDDDDDDETTRQQKLSGNISKFLSLVQEHCLTICGIPFRKIDKKSEKHFLSLRAKLLQHELQKTSSDNNNNNHNDDSSRVLNLTIALLYQQIKQVVIMPFAPSTTSGPTLQLLTCERKISKPIAETLMTLRNQLQNSSSFNEEVNDEEDTSLVETVRQCGLVRDIAKHVIATPSKQK